MHNIIGSKMKKSISRFNKYQVIIDLEAVNDKISKASKTEEIAYNCMMNSIRELDHYESLNDPWWESEMYRIEAAVQYSIKEYHKMSRARMRLEKQHALIIRRLSKFEK